MDMSDALSAGAVAYRIRMKSLSVGKNIERQTTNLGVRSSNLFGRAIIQALLIPAENFGLFFGS
jgi:hypothetical protein